jgi:hypothetical protein
VSDEYQPHLDFADVSGHRWRVQFDDSEPRQLERIYCVNCEGTPEDYSTGAPGLPSFATTAKPDQKRYSDSPAASRASSRSGSCWMPS